MAIGVNDRQRRSSDLLGKEITEVGRPVERFLQLRRWIVNDLEKYAHRMNIPQRRFPISDFDGRNTLLNVVEKHKKQKQMKV